MNRPGAAGWACALALAALLGAGSGCSRAEDAGVAAPAPPGIAPSAEPAPPEKRPPPRPAALARVTIKALGMYCEESCPVRVRQALAGIPSVYELGFDLSKESVFVSYDATLGPAKQVTRPMIAAIKEAGFDPWLARESWPKGAEVRIVSR